MGGLHLLDSELALAPKQDEPLICCVHRLQQTLGVGLEPRGTGETEDDWMDRIREADPHTYDGMMALQDLLILLEMARTAPNPSALVGEWTKKVASELALLPSADISSLEEQDLALRIQNRLHDMGQGATAPQWQDAATQFPTLWFLGWLQDDNLTRTVQHWLAANGFVVKPFGAHHSRPRRNKIRVSSFDPAERKKGENPTRVPPRAEAAGKKK